MTLDGALQATLTAVERLNADVGTAIQAAWSAEARRSLGVSGRSTSEYVRGITVDRSATGVSVKLTGTLANMLEQGMGPGGVGTEGAYDLRIFLLRPSTRNIRSGSKGLYLNVFFRRTMAAIKAAGGSRAGAAARALSPTISLRGRTVWGANLPPGMAPKIRPDHHSDPLAGTSRFQGNYSAASPGGQSTHGNFRTISEGGKPWMHPGIKGRRIAEKVAARLPQIVGDALIASMSGGAR